MANDLRHSIKVVARKTGLSPHLIRAWEKRYATINPERNDGNRRLYSTDEIERLALLKRATDAGHSIGDIAQLPTERLAMLVAQDGHAGGTLRTADEGAQGLNATAASQLVADAYAAVEAMDSGRLEAVLDRGSVVLGQVRLLSEIMSRWCSASGKPGGMAS
jgi:DNA-binding transcriptional MerR regulator